MLVRHPLFVAMPLVLPLVLLGACASDGASRADVATEAPLPAERVEPAAPAAPPESKQEDQDKDNPPVEFASAAPQAPYGWRLHRAPRRIGGGSEGTWRIAGELSDMADGRPMVMPAAPTTTSRLEPPDSAPVAQRVSLAAPATTTQPLLDPAPIGSTSEEAAAISMPADPARASDALVAYAAAAKAAPAPKAAIADPAASGPAADVAAAAAVEPPVEPEVIDRPEWIINVAAHASMEDAQRHVEQLRSTGFKATVRQETVRGRASHRVVIESLPSEAAAKSALANLNKRYGIESAWVMRKR